ncbi:hypothetical protein ACHAPJ_006922 [Fusarium lateritium]
MPVEEPTTVVFTVAKRPATHKTSSQLIVPSLQMLSVIVLVERHHSRISWTIHASLARSKFPTARGFVRRRFNVVTSVSLYAISETVSLAHKQLKSIADVVELRLRQFVTKETSRILCVFEFARPLVTVAGIDVESIAAQVRRKRLSDLPSRRSSVLVPNHFPSKPSISVFSPVEDHSSVAVTFASSCAIAELVKAALRLFGPKSAATAAPQSFIHRNLAALVSRRAQTSVGDRPLVDTPLLIISVILMT